MEFWDYAALREDIEREASRAECDGWDGLSFPDSQNMMPDVYVCLSLAARVTERLGLTTGVTNPVTRHPNVSACAALTLHSLTNGRFRLGIGRGDSSLAHLGLNPVPVPLLSRYVSIVRRLVSGQSVSFAELDELQYNSGSVSPGARVHNLQESEVLWSPPSTTSPPPVDVVATGPRVIAMAATDADGVLLAVGADEARIGWAVELIRDTRRHAGMDPDQVPIGAYVNIAVSRERATAYDLVRPALSVYARFASMHGNATGPLTDGQREVLESAASSYNMKNHGLRSAIDPRSLPDSFIERYAIVGTVDACLQRIENLRQLGISRFIVSRAEPLVSIERSSAAAQTSYLALTKELMPAARAMAAATGVD